MYILDARWGAKAPQLARYLELRFQPQIQDIASIFAWSYDSSLRSRILLRFLPQVWDFASTAASDLGFCLNLGLRSRILLRF